MPPRFEASWSEFVYWSTALAMLVAFLVTFVVMQSDARTIDGHISVWTKPLKFDLRVSHFLATHMIQVVPFIGLLVERLVTNRISVMCVLVIAAFWTLLTIQQYRGALSGVPSAVATVIR